MPEVLRDHAVEVGRVDSGRLRRRELPRARQGIAEVAHDLACEAEGVLVGDGVVVGDAGAPGVDVGAAQLLRRDLLPGGGPHERRPADEDRAGAGDDHGLVAHRRDIRASCRARPHHDGDLRDPFCGQARLVVEDAAEVVAVGEHVGLQRQERAARVDQVEARQVVLLCHLLRPQVLLHGEREVGAPLHGGVVRDDHAVAAFHDADPGHDPGRRRLAAVRVPGGELVELQEGAARSTSRSMRSRAVSLPRERWRATDASPPPSATAAVRSRSSRDELLHAVATLFERRVVLDPARERRHRSEPIGSRPDVSCGGRGGGRCARRKPGSRGAGHRARR